MRHYIIYVPGLGDHYDRGRRFALKFWRVHRVRTELVPMQWYDGRPYEEKYQRVAQAINRATQAGYDVSLIGESAGGSMVLNVAADHHGLHRVVTIGGVDSFAIPVAATTLRKSPAFKQSIAQLKASLAVIDRAKIVTVRAALDPVVARRYSYIEGAREYTLKSIGHLTTIALCLTFASGRIVALVRRSN